MASEAVCAIGPVMSALMVLHGGEVGEAVASSRGSEILAGCSFLVALWTGNSLWCWDTENIQVLTLFCEAIEGSHIKKKMKNPLINMDGKSLGICEPVQSSSAVRCSD